MDDYEVEEDIMVNTFLVIWDAYGLEGVVNVTKMDQEAIIDALKNTDPNRRIISESHRMLNFMILRAKANMDRDYEVYAVNAVDGIAEEDIAEMFTHSPQTAAETIRRLGVCVYENKRPLNQKVVITR